MTVNYTLYAYFRRQDLAMKAREEIASRVPVAMATIDDRYYSQRRTSQHWCLTLKFLDPDPTAHEVTEQIAELYEGTFAGTEPIRRSVKPQEPVEMRFRAVVTADGVEAIHGPYKTLDSATKTGGRHARAALRAGGEQATFRVQELTWIDVTEDQQPDQGQ